MLHSRSRKQTYLVVMPDSRSLFLLARYYPNSTRTIHHRGQVKNPHRLPIRKTSPRKSLPRRLFSDGKVLRLPVLSSFQGSVKSLAGIAVSFYEAIDGQIEFIRMRAWNGLPVFDLLDSRYSLGYRLLRKERIFEKLFHVSYRVYKKA
ncbi:hypothetical protein CDAR_281661 [Caerostris darwini]|uniref:Uncharacterized protein n=1 Tax=Caerostris darwini TaxID=1538125 RepID=A0AAV4Q049_9ARAC|nr:hypothetical protein CDAR_281661 [Caerostris darwini]